MIENQYSHPPATNLRHRRTVSSYTSSLDAPDPSSSVSLENGSNLSQTSMLVSKENESLENLESNEMNENEMPRNLDPVELSVSSGSVESSLSEERKPSSVIPDRQNDGLNNFQRVDLHTRETDDSNILGVNGLNDFRGQVDVGNVDGVHVIPPKHKLQATVKLILPESDYNRNLGVFQVRIDLLASNGLILASSRRPCMLYFKSLPIRLLLTFLKAAPLITGYSSESQDLDIEFKGFTEGDMPISCIRVIIEQRAEFHPGGGIPQLYSASLILESELPLHKRIIWYWKTTLFVWISMTLFTVELLFALLCCKPLIIPRIRLVQSPPTNHASRNNPSTQG
nr:seipin-2-like [Ipomoea trifida]